MCKAAEALHQGFQHQLHPTTLSLCITNPAALHNFVTLQDNSVILHNFIIWISQIFIICWRRTTKTDISTKKKLFWAAFSWLHNHIILMSKKIRTYYKYNHYLGICVICIWVKISLIWVTRVFFVSKNSVPSSTYTKKLTYQD